MLDKPSESDLPPEPSATSPEPPPEQAPPAADPFAIAPVSPDDPCGPDLDLEGDAEFMNFLAATEGLLADEFLRLPARDDRLSGGLPGDARNFSSGSLDVRLLTLAAKLSSARSRRRGLRAFHRQPRLAVAEHWEGAHPRAEGGDYSIRLAQLMALEDNALVLLPLQYARLLDFPARATSPTATSWRRPARSSREP